MEESSAVSTPGAPVGSGEVSDGCWLLNPWGKNLPAVFTATPQGLANCRLATKNSLLKSHKEAHREAIGAPSVLVTGSTTVLPPILHSWHQGQLRMVLTWAEPMSQVPRPCTSALKRALRCAHRPSGQTDHRGTCCPLL